jgi:hypothetical protein
MNLLKDIKTRQWFTDLSGYWSGILLGQHRPFKNFDESILCADIYQVDIGQELFVLEISKNIEEFYKFGWNI